MNGKGYIYCNEIYDRFHENDYEEYKKKIIGTSCELFVNRREPMEVYKEIPKRLKKGKMFIGIYSLVGAESIIFFFSFYNEKIKININLKEKNNG